MADSALIEHLLRRAGFGASSTELATYSALSYAQAVDRLINYEQIPDTVDSNIGKPGYVGTTSRGAVLSQHGRRRCAAAVAVPDAAFGAAAPGEDDALLAQLLRDRLSKVAGQVKGRERHAADGGQGVGGSGRSSEDRSSCFATTRSATSAICSSRSRRTRRCSSGSTATRTRRRSRRKTSAAS